MLMNEVFDWQAYIDLMLNVKGIFGRTLHVDSCQDLCREFLAADDLNTFSILIIQHKLITISKLNSDGLNNVW